MLIRQKDSKPDNKKDGSNTVRALIQYIENIYRDNITNETITEAFHHTSAYKNLQKAYGQNSGEISA